MAARSKTAAALLLLAVLWAGRPVSGATLESLCDPGHPAAAAMESLVEEAEAAGMTEETLKRLLVVGYRNADATETLRRLICAVVVAEESGLPPGLLFGTLEEGLGKRVPIDRILDVVRDKIADLEFSRGLVEVDGRHAVDDPLVERVARVLSLGVSRDEVRGLFAGSPQASVEMRVVAAEVLGYGRALGMPGDLLDEVVSTGLAMRAFTPDWSHFVEVVAAARKRGVEDRTTAETAVAVLSENGTLDEWIGELGIEERELR